MLLEVWLTEDFSLLCSATARRRRTVPSSAASLPASLSSSKTSADGTWRGECLSPSRGEPLRGRRRAHNPTARVGRLQSYTWTSAVESRGGAPSAVTTVKFGGDDRPSVRWNTLIWVSHFFHRVIIRIYVVVGSVAVAVDVVWRWFLSSPKINDVSSISVEISQICYSYWVRNSMHMTNCSINKPKIIFTGQSFSMVIFLKNLSIPPNGYMFFFSDLASKQWHNAWLIAHGVT